MQLFACASRACSLGQQAPRVQVPVQRRAAARPALAHKRPPVSRVFTPRAAGSSGDDADDADANSSNPDQPEMVKRRGKMSEVPVRPELAGELAQLAALCGVTDRAALAEKVAAEGPLREQGVLQHGPQVAAHLQQLGLQQGQLGVLLPKCPLLFSWPAEQRAALLFEQLMGRLGLTVEQATRCFEQQPAAAGVPTFEPAIEVLAELFASVDSTQAAPSEAERQEGYRLLGQLLIRAPAAVSTLQRNGLALRERITTLQQRYGLSPKQLAKAARECASALSRGGHYAAVEVALGEELGMDAEAARQLVFPQEHLKDVGAGPLAHLMASGAATWQLALAVWRVLGVEGAPQLALANTRTLTLNWLQPGRLASLLALQSSLGLPTAGDAVHKTASYVANYAPERLAGRLLFLRQAGLLPLLVMDKKDWRRQRGLPPNKTSPGEPPLISVTDAINKPASQFCALAGVSAADLAAFTAALASHPPYQQLLLEAAALRERLLRDPEVARLDSDDDDATGQ